MRFQNSFLSGSIIFIALTACSETVVATTCGTNAYPIEVLKSAKAADFAEQSADAKGEMADVLSRCLADPDPIIRDGLAYEGLTLILRSGDLDDDQLRSLRNRLLEELSDPDERGFGAPFSALVLSEVARTDRVEAYMTDAEFDALVEAATDYVSSVEDYRGFSDMDGWRHGVAHGADWLMQLTLNPRLSLAQAERILGAVAAQVAADDGHAYIHGEPGRLARPVLFATQTLGWTAEQWSDWLTPILDPAPMESWNDAFKSEEGLARLHNVKAFVSQLYINTPASTNEAFDPLKTASLNALRTLP